MRNAWARLRASVTDRRMARPVEARGTLRVCDTSCRSAAARDRAVASYFSVAGPR